MPEAAVSSSGDPALLTVVEARREIRAKRLSATELTEATLARATRLNPSLGAFLHLDVEGALADARAADARGDDPPLLGIPLCVKDMIDVAGMPTTAGAARWHRMPERDAGAVAALRSAGAIVIGKGNTNEFAYGIDGRNPHRGNCHNPYDLTRLSGGSSSGPAVATAAAMALAGVGTDTTGSIRVPASLCGLVGLRPTLGRVPRDGVVPLAWSYDAVGPLTRSVEDAALLLEVLSGPEERFARARDATQGNGDGLRGLRLGLVEQLDAVAEPYVAAGIAESALQLEAQGAAIVPVRFELLRHANAIHQIVQHAEAAQVHKPWFDEQRDYYGEPVRLRLEVGRLVPSSTYLGAQQARRLLIEEVAAKMQDLDALLAPTTPLVAPSQDIDEVVIRGHRQGLRPALLACVLPPSQLGYPVISVPVGNHDGLPYGMQIIGRPFCEALLLRIASVCERRWSWSENRPAI
jgi:aspartyl-tRNA(Asn)/glutamyl-tRNA(Gln) amidotransferase subunit A